MEKNKDLNTDGAAEADGDLLTKGNTETSGVSNSDNPPSDKVGTEMKDEAARKKAKLKAKLLYSINNYDKIKAEEAEARARITDDEGEILYAILSRKVVRISKDLVVKKASDLGVTEASNLAFVAANTTIPVPKVHDVRWEDGRVVGLVMDYMPGKSLEEVWKTLSPNQKQHISEQIHGYICQLRNLKGNYIGAADRGTVAMGKYTVINGGPFDSEREFNDWILEDLSSGISAPLRYHAKRALADGHEIVFTHADISSRNILVDENCRITAILDWEFAGWYPEWWEYFTAYTDVHRVTDWDEYLIKSILPPRYDREFVAMFYVSQLCRS